ncbi:transmembrane protein 62-like isoform X2 [Oratosquilla oratoria]|uniref:transmembrane protein 62-like isoform X2 n=1 Tax=Oratosquilla oratoria TaxID=337810 RepID=UPI003F7606ED
MHSYQSSPGSIVYYFCIFHLLNSISCQRDSSFVVSTKHGETQLSSSNGIGNSHQTEGVSWFLQFSDIHLGKEADSQYLEEIKEFVENTIKTINPAVVLLTGDVTNNVANYGMTLSQISEDWRHYENLQKSISTLPSTLLWLDLPGNHDIFDDPHHTNFMKFTMLNHLKNDIHGLPVQRVKNNGRNYTFIALDASINPGIRAHHFLGHVSLEKYHQLQKTAKEVEKEGDLIIWYGHYTTSSIVSDGDLRQLMKNSLVYVCGHLHTAYQNIKHMWTHHASGLLELELADWYENRIYRILAVDNGQLVWADVYHKEWPVILPTRVITESEKLFVRLLIFTKEGIQSVQVQSGDDWTICDHLQGPHYVCSVNMPNTRDPILFQIKLFLLHGSSITIEKEVDIKGRDIGSTMSHTFLSLHLHSMFYALTCMGTILCLLPLLLFKYSRKFVPAFLSPCLQSVVGNKVGFGLLLTFIVYPWIGPWYVGDLAGGQQWGYVFMWGIFLQSSYLPGELTYPDAFFVFILLQLPFYIVILFKHHIRMSSSRKWKAICQCCLWFLYIIIILTQIKAIIAWVCFDSIVLCGPLRTILLLLSLSIWYSSR